VQGDVAADGPHESAQVAVEVVDALDDAQNFHHRGLVAGAVAEVGVDRVLDRRTLREHRSLEPLQITAALGQRRRSVAQVGSPLDGEDVAEAFAV
jgi:hypothetical protein